MKCTLRLTKVVIIFLILSFLLACASKSTKSSLSATVSSPNKSSTVVKQEFEPVVNNSSVNEGDKQSYKKALVYLQNGDLLKAENLLKQVSNKYPRMSGPYINLGIIAMRQGRWQDAEQLFSSAKSLRANNPVVLNYLGVIYRQQGKFDEAKEVYLLAIAQDEKFSDAYLNLGILFDLYLSDFALAKKYYNDYLAMVPADEKVKNWLIDLDHRIQVSN